LSHDMTAEQEIFEYLVRLRSAGGRLPRYATVSIKTFWDLARRLAAKIEEGPSGEFVTLFGPTGRIFIDTNASTSDKEVWFGGER
jgi:hypothetical protein